MSCGLLLAPVSLNHVDYFSPLILIPCGFFLLLAYRHSLADVCIKDFCQQRHRASRKELH